MNARSRSWPAVLILLTALLSANVFYSRPAQADPDVDINIFFGALAPYGTWVDHSAYGRVWYPHGVSRGWRPYSDGHWVYNGQYGWVWVSDWVWGWAPFHYGRWVWDDWYGWIWLPGRVWAPAWVFWRYGGGYAAWAPMPPNVIWQPGYGLNMRYFDYDRDLRRDWWVCVPERRLHERNIRRHLIDPRRNDRILNVTRNFVNVKNVNNVIVNQGVPVRQIEKSSGRRVRVVPIREVESMRDRKRVRSKGGLTVVRPKIRAPGADDIRREEELAQNLSRQNEKQRRDQPRTEGKPEIKLPGRLRKGAPAEPAPGGEKGRETIAPPSLQPQERQEQQRRQELQQQRQIEERKRQGEEAERAREEKARQQQLQERQEQQRRLEMQQQRQIEERRQAEQAERAREERKQQQRLQERQQQLQQQRQFHEQQGRVRQEQQRRQEFEQQRQIHMQRQREMDQRQMEIQRQESQKHQPRQQEDGSTEQQRRQQMPPQEMRPGYGPGYGR